MSGERVVWKFPVGWRATVEMPTGAQIVLVDESNDGLLGAYLWAEVDPNAPKEQRTFTIFGTGHVIPPEYHHVGSFISGPFVWHVYEKEKS